MSVTIYVVAQKQLTKTDFTKVDLYNGLWENGYEPPEKLKSELESILGHEIFDDELIPVPFDDALIPVPDGKKVIEINLEGEGFVMYGDGLVIPISSLPINTIAIRVYAVS